MAGRTYRSPLRDEHAAATRERILDAAHRLLGHTRPVDLAYAAVAEAAGVSVRTVYRHFPASDDLFLALSDRLLGALLPGDGPPSPDRLDLAAGKELLRRQFAMMEADPALFRVFFAVPTRSRTQDDLLLERLFGARLTALPPERRRLVYALLDLLGSPYAWDVLHANWGAGGDEAFRATMFGMRAVLALAEASPELLDPAVDPFPVPEAP